MFLGCSISEIETAEELEAYVRNPANRLSITRECGRNCTAAVTFRPMDLLVYQEVDGETFDSSAINLLRKKYSAYYYFILSLSRDNKEALHQAGDQYSELLRKFSFEMGEYVTLSTSQNDTIAVSDFMMQRTFGLSQSTDIIFVFQKAKASRAEWVQFNLNELGLGIGNQRFRFETSKLNNSPSMNFWGLSENYE